MTYKKRYQNYPKKATKKDIARIENKIRDLFFEYGTLQFRDVDEFAMLVEEEVSPVLRDALIKLAESKHIHLSKKIIWEPRPPHQEYWMDYIPF